MRGHLTGCSPVEEAGWVISEARHLPTPRGQRSGRGGHETGRGGAAWSPCSQRGHSRLIWKAAANVTTRPAPPPRGQTQAIQDLGTTVPSEARKCPKKQRCLPLSMCAGEQRLSLVAREKQIPTASVTDAHLPPSQTERQPPCQENLALAALLHSATVFTRLFCVRLPST